MPLSLQYVGMDFLEGDCVDVAPIIGAIIIILALWKVTLVLFSSVSFENPKLKDFLYLIGISFLASIALEWAAKYLELWTYSDFMPIITVFDYEIGLSAITQITFLPVLANYLSHNKQLKWFHKT